MDAVLRVVEQHRHEVGALIEHTVRTWDPEETSRRLELAVGRDLQFVRINGTLVGGLVGLLLYTISRLAGSVLDGALEAHPFIPRYARDDTSGLSPPAAPPTSPIPPAPARIASPAASRP